MSLLEIKDLNIRYITRDNVVHAVNNIELSIDTGETIGLVGETGAGKTTTALGIMRLIQSPPGKIVSGEILFDGTDLIKENESALRKMRGNDISMIFQDPMTSLNPIMRVGDQISELIYLHGKCSRADSVRQSIQMLEMVGIRAERSSEYPHQFSGGMKQRVIIAIALACNPRLLIADEPTTALDVTIQAQVLEMISDLKKERNTSMLLITHDLGIVAQNCDKVAIMYAGQIVEYGTLAHIFRNVSHPYTKGLFNSIPSLVKNVERLKPIPGLMPDPSDLPTGCKFHPRCDMVFEDCSKMNPEMYEIEPGHCVRCLLFRNEGGAQ